MEPTIYDFDPRNLPSDLLRAVGLMVAASAQTEHIVQDLIGAILSIDSAETVALTTHMTGLLKNDVARALIELNATHSGIVDDVDDLLDDVQKATEKRNTVVHNHFCRDPNTGVVFSLRQRARGSLQVSLQPVSVEEIEKDALAIYEAGISIKCFMNAHNLTPGNRTRRLREPLDRKKTARKLRRDKAVRNTK